MTPASILDQTKAVLAHFQNVLDTTDDPRLRFHLSTKTIPEIEAVLRGEWVPPFKGAKVYFPKSMRRV